MRVEQAHDAPETRDRAPADEAMAETPETRDEPRSTTLLRPTLLLAALAVVQVAIALDVTLPVVRPLLAL
ncbi:MAG: hypothetical protein ABWY19_10905, partial [Marmoricola sp.]